MESDSLVDDSDKISMKKRKMENSLTNHSSVFQLLIKFDYFRIIFQLFFPTDPYL